MMIIAVTNHKGGVGKTTIAMNLGLSLAARGRRVVLVDADAQGTLTEGLGFEQAPGFYDVLVRDANFADVIQQIPGDNFLTADGPHGFAGLVCGNQETRHIAESISDAAAVQERFSVLEGAVDFVIFDMAPTESMLHPLVYVACDGVIYPTICEAWSVESLRRTMDYVEKAQSFRVGLGLPKTETLGIVPTIFRDTNIHRIYLEQLTEEYGEAVTVPVKQRIVWSEAAAFHQAVFVYDEFSEASADVWTLADLAEGLYES